MFKFRLGLSKHRLVLADCKIYMDTLADNSIDSICTDIPYNIGIFKKKWDVKQAPLAYQLWNESWATKAYRVLKPGAHMLVFMSPVTQHRCYLWF